MFRTVTLSIIRSFSLYTQQWYMSYRFADSCQRNCPKHVEFYSKNKFEKLVHLVGLIIRIYILLLLLLSALQLLVSSGLLNYFFPLFLLLRLLFPIGHPHLPHIIPHFAFPSVLLHTVSICIWS